MNYIESGEQVALFHWAFIRERRWPQLKNMFRVPNGGKKEMKQDKKGRWYCPSGARSKREGERAGVPDVMLAWPTTGSQWPNSKGYPGLFIEMKKSEKEKLEPEQVEWKERLIKAGYKHVVCWTWTQAAEVICDYLGVEDEHL